MSKLNIKRSTLLVALFAAGVAIGVSLTWRTLAPALPKIGAGDTLVSYAGDEVMSLTYTTRRGTVTAQRSQPGRSFIVQTTFADGRPQQRCGTAPDLAGALGVFVEVTAKRAISLQQRDREFPVQLGVLDIRDRALGEPGGPMLVFTNRNRTGVAIIMDGYAAEVTMPLAQLDWLEAGCTSLAQAIK